MTKTKNATLQTVDVGGRMIPVGHLHMGEQVIAYNPHLNPIAREGGSSEIASEEETPVRVTSYYLGCFQRGSLYALQPKPEVSFERILPEPNPLLRSEQNLSSVEARPLRRKKEDRNQGDEPPGSLSTLSIPKETL